MQLRWSLPAVEDLERICEWIARDNPEAARRIARTIYERCAGLEHFPYQGRESLRLPGRRELLSATGEKIPVSISAALVFDDEGREIATVGIFSDLRERLRMEERLETAVNVPEGLKSAVFPSMMLQTLVENAIKHGLEPRAVGGRLEINAEIVDGQLAVHVVRRLGAAPERELAIPGVLRETGVLLDW